MRVAGSFKCLIVVFGKTVVVIVPEVSKLNTRCLDAEIAQGETDPDQNFTAHLKSLSYEENPLDSCGNNEFLFPVDYNECSCVPSEADPDH